MIIEYLGKRLDAGFCVIEARFVWEDSDREPERICFAVPQAHARKVADRVDPFLVCALPPALWSGERRLATEHPTCGVLLENLRDFAYFQQLYFGDTRPALEIEALVAPDIAGGDRVAASLFSGGADSTFSLLKNHEIHRDGDPARVKVALWHARDPGFDVQATDVIDRLSRKAERHRDLTDAMGVDLILVFSNSHKLWLGRNDFFWAEKWHGAGFAAAGHALADGVDRLLIPSSELDLRKLRWGSNPLGDGYLASTRLRIHHDGARFSREDKLRYLASHPDAMRGLKVCFNTSADWLNCGRCEKCLRTRLALHCLGVPREMTPFPNEPIDPALFDQRGTHDENLLPFYRRVLTQLADDRDAGLKTAVQGFFERSVIMVERGEMLWPVYWEN